MRWSDNQSLSGLRWPSLVSCPHKFRDLKSTQPIFYGSLLILILISFLGYRTEFFAMSTTQLASSRKDRALRVFLCYASTDEPMVRDLYNRLKKDGFAPWLDKENLLPGQSWEEEVSAAVRNADVVIVCLSRSSITTEGYVQKEVKLALDVADEKPPRTIFVIPARLEEGVTIPQRLTRWQAVDLFQDDGYQRLILALNSRAEKLGIAGVPRARLPLVGTDMPEHQENQQSTFLLPLKVLRIAKRCADAWAHLTREEKVNWILAILVSGSLLASRWLAPRFLWVPLGIVAAVGSLSFLLLAWRLMSSRQREGRLSTRWRVIIITIAVVLLCASLVVYWRFQNATLAEVSRNHNHLKKCGLPAELYEHQRHLDTLSINQTSGIKQNSATNPPLLSDVDWLSSDDLKNLTIASPKLSSLDGLAHISKLQTLDIDLTGTPIASLRALSSLHELASLTIRGIAKAKTPPFPEIGESFLKLTTLYLDFRGSKLSALPVLTASEQLKNLTLDLRSTTEISKPPDLSQLQHLRTLAILVDNSKVTSLKPLFGNIEALTTLRLGLDGRQLDLLSGLARSQGPEQLDLDLSSPANTKFPDLHGMSRLKTFILHLPGPAGTVSSGRAPASNGYKDGVNTLLFPDVNSFPRIEELEIFLDGSDIAEMSDIGKFTGLLNLNLHLEGSGIQRLPNISSLQNLTGLTLDISNTNIAELPDFKPFPNLVELHLLMANDAKVRSLGIENLGKLGTLELDITGRPATDRIVDLASIVKLGRLNDLSLHLRWQQVADLPDLRQIKSLQKLRLYLEGGSNHPEFPDLTGLQTLQELALYTSNPNVTKLPDLSDSPQLRTITLNLNDSGIEDLTALEHVNNLKELTLSLARTPIQSLPNLKSLNQLKKVKADIRYSQITVDQTQSLAKLQELTVDQGFSSLHDLPETVTKLHFQGQKPQQGLSQPTADDRRRLD